MARRWCYQSHRASARFRSTLLALKTMNLFSFSVPAREIHRIICANSFTVCYHHRQKWAELLNFVGFAPCVRVLNCIQGFCGGDPSVRRSQANRRGQE